MNFPTTLLSIFAKHSGDQAPADGRMAVPNVLQPTISIPEAYSQTDGLIAADLVLKNTSFIRAAAYTNTNSAGVAFTLFVLAPGIWELEYNIMACCNFTSFNAQASAAYQSLSGATATNFFQYVPGFSNIYAQIAFTHKITVADPAGLQVSAGTVANGVGQTTYMLLFVNAKRLG